MELINRLDTLILVYITLGNFLVDIMPSRMNRVVFQSFMMTGSLDSETVQCYGKCKENHNDVRQKVNVTRCDGRRIRFSCMYGYSIKIHFATLGTLDPEFDICSYKEPLECSRNISLKIQERCKHVHMCTVNVQNYHVESKCRSAKYTAVDINYSCEIKTTTEIPTTEITTSTTKATSWNHSGIKVVRTMSGLSSNGLSPSALPTIIPPHITIHDDKNTGLMAKLSQGTNMFWSLTAYTAISDSEYIKKHVTHLSLAILLSIFVGMVICLCFLLDVSRRARKKRGRHVNSGVFATAESAQRLELDNPKMVEVITLNGDLTQHKTFSYHDGDNNNDNIDEDDVYDSRSPFLKRSLVHKLIIHNHMKADKERSPSPSSLPPPPYEFLMKSSSSSSSELLPPPVGFNGDKCHLPHLVVTNPTPSESTPNTLLNADKSVTHEKSNSEKAEAYVDEQTLDDSLECSRYEYAEVAQYHASDEYSSSPQNPRSTTYHLMNRRTTSNDEPSQKKSLIKNTESKRMRNRKCNSNCISKCNSKNRVCFEQRNNCKKTGNSYFTNNGYLVRNPKKGRINLLQKFQLIPGSSNQKITYSDNEVSRRRRRFGSEHKRACNCYDPAGTSLGNLYCTTCGQSEEAHLKCCPSCQSSHDEESQDDQRTLPLGLIQRIKNKQFPIEESGYQSHDTDSLCSSAFSTDQEDSRISSPASASSAEHTGCQKFFSVSDHNKSKVPYTNIDVHRHDNHTSIDVHSYGSSLDEGSSRDSVKIFRRMRKENSGLPELDEDTNCNWVYRIKPPDVKVTIDGIETT